MEVWKHNRALYPGWLVAPQTVCQRILRNTKHWVPYYVKHGTSLSKLEHLSFLFELNWRLEIALVPIWNDLIVPIQKALAALNPFPESLKDFPQEAISPMTDPTSDWHSLREQWTMLALGLLRLYREERETDQFQIWHKRLAGIPELQSSSKARLNYEFCLYSLSQMDDEAVTRNLSQWPASVNDSQWHIRRAGLLAEIGRPDDALAVVESILKFQRLGSADTVADIPWLSREGWALNLRSGLRFNISHRSGNPQWYSDHEADRLSMIYRFRQLRPFGADPEDVKEFLGNQLQQPPPIENSSVTYQAGFEAGRVTRTTNFGGESPSDKLLPAYQFMRLCEESGIPPIAGNVILFEKTLIRAAEWFRETVEQVRTQSLMFRLLSDQVTTEYLSRHRIAALPIEQIQRWRSMAIGTIKAALPGAGKGLRDETNEQRRARKRLATALTILSRVLVRDHNEGLNEIWAVADSLYREELVRNGITLADPFKSLITNLVQSTPLSVLKSKLLPLAKLSLHGEPSYSVRDPDRWPDPVQMIAERLVSLSVRLNKTEWRPVIDRHINLLKSNEVKLRQAAMWRISLLNDMGLVSAEDQELIARSFWTPVTHGSELPFESWGFATAWLALSWPISGPTASDRVKEYILSYPLGDVYGGVVRPANIFSLVLYASKRTRFGRLQKRQFISWTAADIEQLIAKIIEWWNSYGKKRVAELQKPHFSLFDDASVLREFFNGIWDVIREVIIPKLQINSDTARTVLAFVDEIHNAGLPVGAVLPAVLIVDRKRKVKVISQLRSEFAHASIDFYLSALRGIVYWASSKSANTRGGKLLPPIPVELIRKVASSVELRRHDVNALKLSMDAALAILRGHEKIADKQFRDSLIVGLDYLYAETTYRQTADSNALIPYDRVPEIRVYCVQIASHLARLGSEKNTIIKRWMEAAINDALPEVRQCVELAEINKGA